ncbi:hypothetical protein BC628DRAFT_1371875 [Trametes gibbosa]|nr:hypothetical protein BC628DRAFT_1371875 [Trametes gibbosa]
MPAVTKSMPSASSSSNPVNDALANLTRAATVAFNTVQEQAQADVAHALAERNDAVKSLHEAQLDAKDLELREEGWRAALEKTEMTIKHQADTIVQLQNEVAQWKTQLTRLEDSSRQEIDDWKEQYRRAEHERARLSARIDELVASQFAWNAAAQAYNTPYTPRLAYTNMPEPSASTSQTSMRASTSHSRRQGGTPHRSSRTQPDIEEYIPPRRRIGTTAQADRDAGSRSRGGSPTRPATSRRKEPVSVEAPHAGDSRTAPRASLAHPSPAAQVHTEPLQRVIRRVTAIVEVKEEEPDDPLEDGESVRSGSVYEPDRDEPPPAPRRRRPSQPSAARRRQIVQDWDEDEQTPDVGDGADARVEPEDDEDDELLLGRSVKSKPPPPKGAAKQPRTKAAGTAKTLKRKIDADAGAPSGRAGTAKAAKTR